ncbi:hypothetical protein [Sandaracinus amylolyticus]|uniref:hypothetical protein n=1 Tax=Sandaracinus amylolyticus TaxID=927083 RepID=UPI001F3B54BC|nr:hypothetical protein [Sandaracinus amylolyticus]UJR78906.1 Hypothetical protein I5071_9390 [Sandaracinus amylolyticus]
MKTIRQLDQVAPNAYRYRGWSIREVVRDGQLGWKCGTEDQAHASLDAACDWIDVEESKPKRR